MNHGEETPSVSETLSKLSGHLDMLAGQIFGVEEALGAILSDESQHRGLPITRLQSLDFARQSLEDCALMLQVLSKQKSSQGAWENIEGLQRKLKLDTTRSLLSSSASISLAHESGELDLF